MWASCAPWIPSISCFPRQRQWSPCCPGRRSSPFPTTMLSSCTRCTTMFLSPPSSGTCSLRRRRQPDALPYPAGLRSCPARKVHPDLQSEGLRLADRSFRLWSCTPVLSGSAIMQDRCSSPMGARFPRPRTLGQDSRFSQAFAQTASMGLTPTRRMAPTI